MFCKHGLLKCILRMENVREASPLAAAEEVNCPADERARRSSDEVVIVEIDLSCKGGGLDTSTQSKVDLDGGVSCVL